jgi:hypothetical protein
LADWLKKGGALKMSEEDLRTASEKGSYEQASKLIEAGVSANNTDAVIFYAKLRRKLRA